MNEKDYSSYYNYKEYKRKPTVEVAIGSSPLGGRNPIRLQTMTSTNTNDIDATVEQSVRAIEAGAEYIRITTQGVREAKSLEKIKNELREIGYKTPIIADIHFNPSAALEAAKYADKIRINPGNYSEKSRTSAFNLSASDYEAELLQAEERFLGLLEICRQNNVAIRIGVNHGSLSHRIMNRYGDTPEGMAHSAMEFIRICHKHNHHQLVVSMKSSNTRVMVQATRYLHKMMNDEGMSYPLHLGVTEAGEGEDGRIKSAVGIGALLVDGLGDTIRVSLTEDPEKEIPVAKLLVDLFKYWDNKKITITPKKIEVNPFEYNKRKTATLLNVGGENPPIVMADISQQNQQLIESIEEWGWTYSESTGEWSANEHAADYFYLGKASTTQIPHPEALPLVGNEKHCKHRCFDICSSDFSSSLQDQPFFIEVNVSSLKLEQLLLLKNHPSAIIILKAGSPYSFYNVRNTLFALIENDIENPCIISFNFPEESTSNLQIESAAIAGSLFLDGMGDGLMISASQHIAQKSIRAITFGILQAARVRITRTEFISCPGCGRTLFNLNETLRKVKEKTAHLKGLKIGVMGCIVNGPGEMADADYGYVGSGKGLVTLYRKKEVIQKNIPESQAVDKLIQLIKDNNDWVDT
ncbi:MAG: (E)-4-hydroxy-3-methylbut-2-enyl-diphosphate synthase [Bacteroidales bacterium]